MPGIEEKTWRREWEEELYNRWEEEGLHKSILDPEDPREIVVIDTPPPYASGKWHAGGAAHYAQIDMIARYFRLKGYNVVVPFYADRNGLPVEVQVEKTYKVIAHEMAKTPEGRRRFLQLCKEFLDKAEMDIVRVWKRMGCSFDYWRDGTDSPTYRALTQATFIELFKRGLIYEAERPVRWCPRCRTTLAEAEIEYKTEEAYIYYVKYTLKDSGEPLIVATTRPELLAGCAALAYNPKDNRYKGLAGRKAIAPLYGHEVVIVEHPSVDPEFGTGLMMICSYGDEDDVRLFMELGLKPRVLIGEDGRMLPEAGPIAGLPVEKAREEIARLLEEKGLLVKKEKITHNVPVCWRCKTPLQIIHRKELFLKQLEFREAVRSVASRISFHPEMHRRKLYDWIDSLTMDWPISRDRFYATEIPLWRCTKCGALLVPEPGKYYRPWEEEPPWERCPHCGASREALVGEKRVFDTWFDSSISPLYVTQWMRNPKFYERAKHNVLRPQGQDIIRTWLYYTILRVYQLTGRPAFRWVRITGMGLAPDGRPMHKSLGNVIDPEPLIDEYGADGFRFWAATAAKLGYDYKVDYGRLRTGRNFVTKLWNLARFVSRFDRPSLEEARLREIDRAFLALLDEYLEKADKAFSNLDVYEPALSLYEYAWDYYASNYVEMVKERAYNRTGRYSREEQLGAWYTLHEILGRVTIGLSPVMPFVTDMIHRRLYGGSVHTKKWPPPFVADPEERRRLAEVARLTVKANREVWTYKKKNNIKLREPIPSARLLIPEKLAGVASEFEDLHKTSVGIYAGKPPESAEPLGEIVYLQRLEEGA